MPALTGTLAQSKDLFVSGTVNQLYGITANAAENVAWAVDNARGEVQRVTGIGSTLANSVIATGLTNPNACALSVDETQLYVLQFNGVLLTMDPTTGVNSQIGTLAALSTQWRYMVNGRNGFLYMISADVKAIHRYNLADNTSALWLSLPGTMWGSGLTLSPNGTYLYTFLGSGGPNGVGILVRVVVAQGRIEVVAGTNVAANTDGDAFLVAAFNTSGDVAVDTSGVFVYAGIDLNANSRIRVVTGGSTTSLNVGTRWGGGLTPRMWMLRSANKLLMTNGTTQVGVIT